MARASIGSTSGAACAARPVRSGQDGPRDRLPGRPADRAGPGADGSFRPSTRTARASGPVATTRARSERLPGCFTVVMGRQPRRLPSRPTTAVRCHIRIFGQAWTSVSDADDRGTIRTESARPDGERSVVRTTVETRRAVLLRADGATVRRHTRLDDRQRVQVVWPRSIGARRTDRGLGPVGRATRQILTATSSRRDGTAVFASYAADKTARLVPIDGSRQSSSSRASSRSWHTSGWRPDPREPSPATDRRPRGGRRFALAIWPWPTASP